MSTRLSTGYVPDMPDIVSGQDNRTNGHDMGVSLETQCPVSGPRSLVSPRISKKKSNNGRGLQLGAEDIESSALAAVSSVNTEGNRKTVDGDSPTVTPHCHDHLPSGDIGSTSGRGRDGRFARGNQAAIVAGAHSRAFWAAVESDRQRLREDILSARGFASDDDAPAALRLVADGAAQASLLRDAAWQRLVESGGPSTDAGRVRRVMGVWLEAHDRALAGLKAIGLTKLTDPKLAGMSGLIASVRDGRSTNHSAKTTKEPL